MGRFATAAIIAVAFAAATAQSFAADTAPPQPGAPQPGAPQPVAAAPRPMPEAMGWKGPPMGMGPMGWHGREMGPPHGMPPFFARMREEAMNWGLFAPRADKKLSQGDVQILAEAVLLRHGYHDWKVTDLATGADGAITFAYATADGSVIARFSVDPQSGHFSRIG